MTAFIIRRLVNLIPTFVIATFLAWIVIEAAPGDFATQFEFNTVDPGQAERIRQQLGLDQPWYVRYFYWLRGVFFEGSLGTSMTSKGEVANLVLPRMWNSLTLILPATFLIYLISIPIAVYSAVRKYSIGDRLLTVFSLIGLAIPNFFLGLLVVGFAVQWRLSTGDFLIPVGGMTSANYSQLTFWGQIWDRMWHLIGPVFVVTLSGLAGLTRITRGQMLDVMAQDYIRTAKAKGLAASIVTYKHALRNAIIPIIATIGSLLPGLLLGAGAVEFVTRWPGLTPLFIRSIFSQDIYVVMAILTIGTVLLIVGNLISDILLALVDPRIRY